MMAIAGGDGGSFRPGEEKANVRHKLPGQQPVASERIDLLDPADPPLLLTPVGHGQCGMLH